MKGRKKFHGKFESVFRNRITSTGRSVRLKYTFQKRFLYPAAISQVILHYKLAKNSEKK